MLSLGLFGPRFGDEKARVLACDEKKMGHPCPGISTDCFGRQLRFQVVNCGHEVDSLNHHDEVDRIEVPLADETAAQISSGIGGGQELAAQWAEKHETSLAAFVRPVQAD